MKKLRNLFIWFRMFNKRLFKKVSFLALLLLIPLIVSSATFVMSEDKSMLKVGLLLSDEDENAKAVADALMAKEGVLSFTLYSDREKLVDDVKTAVLDSAWIFEEDFTEKVRFLAQDKEDSPLPVTVVERESTIPQRLSHVQMIATLFDPISEIFCEEYIYENVASTDELSKEEFKKLFDSYRDQDRIIVLEKVGTYVEDENEDEADDYLLSPIRGLLSVMVVLCGLAACLYFLGDKASGKYQWLPDSKHVFPALTMCFSAVLISAITIFATIYFSGLFLSPKQEIPAILVLLFSATAFSFVFCNLFNDPGKFGALIPAFVIILISLSPIFFNLKILAFIRFLLPTTYYLNALYNPMYLWFGLIYGIAAFAAAFLIKALMIKVKPVRR